MKDPLNIIKGSHFSTLKPHSNRIYFSRGGGVISILRALVSNFNPVQSAHVCVFDFFSNAVQTFMVPSGWIHPWRFLWCHHEVDICGFEGNVSRIIGWIVTKFGTHIHVTFRMNCNNFGDPLTCYLAPSSGQNLNVSSTVVYDQIPAELMTVPSASAVLCV